MAKCVACGCTAPAGIDVCDRCQQAEYEHQALSADADRDREREYLDELEADCEF